MTAFHTKILHIPKFWVALSVEGKDGWTDEWGNFLSPEWESLAFSCNRRSRRHSRKYLRTSTIYLRNYPPWWNFWIRLRFWECIFLIFRHCSILDCIHATSEKFVLWTARLAHKYQRYFMCSYHQRRRKWLSDGSIVPPVASVAYSLAVWFTLSPLRARMAGKKPHTKLNAARWWCEIIVFDPSFLPYRWASRSLTLIEFFFQLTKISLIKGVSIDRWLCSA